MMIFVLVSAATAKEVKCSVTWSAGTFQGKGRLLKRALEDARDACHENESIAEHECGPPLQTSTV